VFVKKKEIFSVSTKKKQPINCIRRILGKERGRAVKNGVHLRGRKVVERRKVGKTGRGGGV